MRQTVKHLGVRTLCFLLLFTMMSTMAGMAIADSNKSFLYPVGSIILIGRYEQDGNFTNGSEKIEWMIYDQDDSGIYLISKMILDLQRYNIEKKDTTWGDSHLRNWLNGTFFNSAFSTTEKEKLLPRKYYDTDGFLLEDYVFCMSSDEVSTVWPSEASRVAQVTDMVMNKEDYTNKTAYGQWWLRSDSTYNGIFRTAEDVYGSGAMGIDNFRNTTVGVRPCIYINLEHLKPTNKADVEEEPIEREQTELKNSEVDENVLILGKDDAFALEKKEGYEYFTPNSDLGDHETTYGYVFSRDEHCVAFVCNQSFSCEIDYFQTDNNKDINQREKINRCLSLTFSDGAHFYENPFLVYPISSCDLEIYQADHLDDQVTVEYVYFYVIFEHGIALVSANSHDEAVIEFAREVAFSIRAFDYNDFI